jgi:hypothetical protein
MADEDFPGEGGWLAPLFARTPRTVKLRSEDRIKIADAARALYESMVAILGETQAKAIWQQATRRRRGRKRGSTRYDDKRLVQITELVLASHSQDPKQTWFDTIGRVHHGTFGAAVGNSSDAVAKRLQRAFRGRRKLDQEEYERRLKALEAEIAVQNQGQQTDGNSCPPDKNSPPG